jgi:polyisoprenoid-binding protein YceI
MHARLVSMFAPELAVALAVALTAPAVAQAASVLPAQSEIDFTTRQMGVPVKGRFRKFSAEIALDPKKPETGSVAFSIDTASVRFGSAELEREIVKPQWLNTPKFPLASFRSSAIRGAGPGRYIVSGTLTIKGAAHEVTVPVQLIQAAVPAGVSTASGEFTIRRLDFRIGEAEWTDTSMLANDVIVRFKLAITGLPAL